MRNRGLVYFSILPSLIIFAASVLAEDEFTIPLTNLEITYKISTVVTQDNSETGRRLDGTEVAYFDLEKGLYFKETRINKLSKFELIRSEATYKWDENREMPTAIRFDHEKVLTPETLLGRVSGSLGEPLDKEEKILGRKCKNYKNEYRTSCIWNGVMLKETRPMTDTGKVLTEYEAVKIQTNTTFKPNLFSLPSGINFQSPEQMIVGIAKDLQASLGLETTPTSVSIDSPVATRGAARAPAVRTLKIAYRVFGTRKLRDNTIDRKQLGTRERYIDFVALRSRDVESRPTSRTIKIVNENKKYEYKEGAETIRFSSFMVKSSDQLGDYEAHQFEQDTKETRIISGKQCVVFKGPFSESCLWDGIELFIELNMGPGKLTIEATEILENLTFASELFSLPKGTWRLRKRCG